MPEENKVELEQTNGQDANVKDDKDSTQQNGQDVSFDDLLKDEKYAKEFQKRVDKRVSEAVKTYQTNHKTDVDALINQKVSEEVNKVKFKASLKENLLKAGVIDTTALIAHLDLNELEKTFDADKEEFKGLDKLISESKEKMPYLFKQEKQGATGQAQTSFGDGKNTAHNLREALAERYKK